MRRGAITPDDRLYAALERRIPFQPLVWWLYGVPAPHTDVAAVDYAHARRRPPGAYWAAERLDRAAMWLNAHQLTRPLPRHVPYARIPAEVRDILSDSATDEQVERWWNARNHQLGDLRPRLVWEIDDDARADLLDMVRTHAGGDL